ncbi:MAG TPA: hypothetical protein VE954_16575, partial [Oligoflexus sp.]|uniref:hypothetical protein n=1 Tax=Oligoflexus sp. TaxID=1971216 RepID=UPI002D3C6532
VYFYLFSWKYRVPPRTMSAVHWDVRKAEDCPYALLSLMITSLCRYKTPSESLRACARLE